jgi:hypothetical protein
MCIYSIARAACARSQLSYSSIHRSSCSPNLPTVSLTTIQQLSITIVGQAQHNRNLNSRGDRTRGDAVYAKQ